MQNGNANHINLITKYKLNHFEKAVATFANLKSHCRFFQPPRVILD